MVIKRELVGTSYNQWRSSIHPEDVAVVIHKIVVRRAPYLQGIVDSIVNGSSSCSTRAEKSHDSRAVCFLKPSTIVGHVLCELFLSVLLLVKPWQHIVISTCMHVLILL